MKKLYVLTALVSSVFLGGGYANASVDTSSLKKPQGATYYIHSASVNFNTKEQKDKAHNLIFHGQDFPLAIAILNKVIEVDKNDSEAYILRALAYSETKEYTKADYDYKEALMLEPENPTFYYLRGMNYLYEGIYKKNSAYLIPKAGDTFEKALKLEPNYINAMVGMGDACYYYARKGYSEMKNYKTAIDWYNEVLVLYPNHNIVQTKKADAMERLNALEEKYRREELSRKIG